MMEPLPIISPTKNQHIISRATSAFLPPSFTVKLRNFIVMKFWYTRPACSIAAPISPGMGGNSSLRACPQNVFSLGREKEIVRWTSDTDRLAVFLPIRTSIAIFATINRFVKSVKF